MSFLSAFLPCSSFEDLLAIIERKIPLFIGMSLFAIGSVGCAMSDAMAALFGRVFQAVGACVGPMLSRAKIVKCEAIFSVARRPRRCSLC